MVIASKSGAAAPHPSVEDRIAAGRAARKAVPRSVHAEWDPASRTHDSIELLQQQAATRVPELVPIRHGRMATSPFANYRGAALMMAADLATGPDSGLIVQLCGDAHLSNFGGFASPERKLVFDLNDFDETLPGPFEWDVKRFAASLEVAARSRNFAPKVRTGIALAGMASYREAMTTFAGMRDLEVWYAALDVEATLAAAMTTASAAVRKRVDKKLAKAKGKDQLKAAAKLTEVVDGQLRFISDPPLFIPARDLLDEAQAARLAVGASDILKQYQQTLSADRRHLIKRYQFVDLARKVVGVGSVGTRAWVALFVGRDENDTLILQIKEAQDSVLEQFLPRSQYLNHGRRVVEGQKLMQAASDIFLGWQRTNGIDGVDRDFFMRQLWDWKVSAEPEVMEPETMATYARMCGWTLARAHARTGDRVAIASYLGASTSFDKALASYAAAYAEQNERDHAALVAAIADGRLPAEAGI